MAWRQLLGIMQDARELDEQELNKVPVECPNDFTALQDAGDGILFCPWDGWQYPRDA